MIPKFYEISAAKSAGYTFYHDWQTLSPREKAVLVAHWYMDREIDSHIEDAKAKDMKKKSK